MQTKKGGLQSARTCCFQDQGCGIFLYPSTCTVLCFFFGSEEADLETLMFLVLLIVIFFDKDLLVFCDLLQHENRGSSIYVSQRKDIR